MLPIIGTPNTHRATTSPAQNSNIAMERSGRSFAPMKRAARNRGDVELVESTDLLSRTMFIAVIIVPTSVSS